MGAFVSRTSSNNGAANIESCANDYELIIRIAKHLDVTLSLLAQSPLAHNVDERNHHQHAQSPGLHERITQAHLPLDLEKKLRFLTTVRNGLVHDTNVTKLDNRAAIIATFKSVRESLEARVHAADAAKNGQTQGKKSGSGGCTIS
jgi:hypothetical protein